MKSITNKNDFWLYGYYILMLAVYLSWDSSESVPGPLLRLAYFGAVLVPVFFWRHTWLPAVIVLFNSLALNGYGSSYLPAVYYTYIAGIIVGLFFMRNDKRERLEIPVCLLLIVFISTIRNIFDGLSIERVTTVGFVTILLLLGVCKNDLYQRTIFEQSLIIISLVLSLSFFLYGGNHTSNVVGYDEERTSFSDINYVACIIGFGVLLTMVKLLNEKHLSFLARLFYIVVVFLSVVSLFLNASRGSILALGLGTAIIIFMSRVSVWWKVFYGIFLAVFLVFLYTNHYMDLLFYRITFDDTGRSNIWLAKWKAFMQSDILTGFLVGHGFTGGRLLGSKYGGVAFHNDFLAFFMEYGIIGLIPFLLFFFLPLIKSNRLNRDKVLAYTCYMFIVCLTLEPYAAGRLPFYAFWIYTYWLSKSNLNEIGSYEKNIVRSK